LELERRRLRVGMNKITPHLWFDTEAKEAAEFYTSVFPDSRITSSTTLRNTPSGDTDVVTFDLAGHRFMAISAGPLFRFNPSVSFILNFDPSKNASARQNLDAMWQKLTEGGTALMPLDEYPFSERYGWASDRYGVSWQLILSDPAGEDRPFIVPSLMFVGSNVGRAEEAVRFYTSVFRNVRQGLVARYGEGQEPDQEGTIMFSDFMIENQWFAAMDSAQEHDFGFNEAISFLIDCQTQEEIDYYWGKLSAIPEAEQCGWLKDKFGVSWQVTPADLETMLNQGTPDQVARVTEAFLKMKKFDLAKLRQVYEEGTSDA
jgi:predicted 3-demethylubiquinone-9 3-methyltransferase (glyoxalase superfamily)